MQNVLRNVWYAAAWSCDLIVGKMVDRTILDVRVVLFRTAAGTPAALSNMCPHRFVPLSMGKLCNAGSTIECAYHGLRFDAFGACIGNPQGNVPRGARVRAFPVAECYSAIWIWMGDPDLANASLIPSIDFLMPEDWAVGTGVSVVRSDYQLETDNIMDLSHIEFLHPMFSSEAVRSGKMESRQEGDTVWSRRMIYNDDPPEFIRKAFQIPAGKRVDRWLDVRWNAPAIMALWTGGVETGRPRAEGIDWRSAHFFTPVDANTTLYFWAISFSRAVDGSEQLAMESRDALRYPFENEDTPVIEAAHANMRGREFWSLQPLILRGDGGSIRARRLLQSMIARERGETPTASAVPLD